MGERFKPRKLDIRKIKRAPSRAETRRVLRPTAKKLSKQISKLKGVKQPKYTIPPKEQKIITLRIPKIFLRMGQRAIRRKFRKEMNKAGLTNVFKLKFKTANSSFTGQKKSKFRAIMRGLKKGIGARYNKGESTASIILKKQPGKSNPVNITVSGRIAVPGLSQTHKATIGFIYNHKTKTITANFTIIVPKIANLGEKALQLRVGGSVSASQQGSTGTGMVSVGNKYGNLIAQGTVRVENGRKSGRIVLGLSIAI